jgi:hypothetical protein
LIHGYFKVQVFENKQGWADGTFEFLYYIRYSNQN